jgi:hypothetical protein
MASIDEYLKLTQVYNEINFSDFSSGRKRTPDYSISDTLKNFKNNMLGDNNKRQERFNDNPKQNQFNKMNKEAYRNMSDFLYKNDEDENDGEENDNDMMRPNKKNKKFKNIKNKPIFNKIENKPDNKKNKVFNKIENLNIKFRINKNFSTAERNFKNFYRSFAEIMKKNIVRPNFDFFDAYEEKLCLNIIESAGDFKKYIKSQYPNIKISFNQNDPKVTYESYIRLFQIIESDIKAKIKTVPTDIEKFSILKGIKV